MAVFKSNEKHIKPTAYMITGLFLCTATGYFLPSFAIPFKIALPVLTLAITSLWLCPWQISLALAFSAAGDFMGSIDMLPGQIGFFALAHICLIWYFAIRYHQKVEPDRKLTSKAKGYMTMIGFCALSILLISFIRIAPHAPAGIIRTGIYVYSTIICLMLIAAMLQRSSLYALGAVLFVFSDFILAWNLFVEPIHGAGYMIMIPYYMAQWLFFIRSTPYRIAPEMRILRF